MFGLNFNFNRILTKTTLNRRKQKSSYMTATTIYPDQLHTLIMTSMFTVVLNDPQVCILITVWVCLSALGQLVKMLISFEPHGYLDQILHIFYYYYCPSTGMQNGDEAGKGLTSWPSFVVSTVSLSLSHWYPGSGVVLYCIDS